MLREKLPGVLDRVALEVVAEGEVPEHFEERVVARRVADVVKVVVLAAGADALLRGRRAGIGALVEPEEDVLELVHAGVREEKRRVVPRDNGARMYDRVTFAGVEVQKGPSNVSDFHNLRLRCDLEFGGRSALAGLCRVWRRPGAGVITGRPKGFGRLESRSGGLRRAQMRSETSHCSLHAWRARPRSQTKRLKREIFLTLPGRFGAFGTKLRRPESESPLQPLAEAGEGLCRPAPEGAAGKGRQAMRE